MKNFTNQRKKGYYGSHVICTQYHIKKGLKVFGKRGEEAVATELRQLHVRDELDPRTPSKLSTQEHASALAYLMFLKEKRTGKVKGRVVLIVDLRETTWPRRKTVHQLLLLKL